MKLFRHARNRRSPSYRKPRKRSSIKRTPQLAPESLEHRRLMAADAFDVVVPENVLVARDDTPAITYSSDQVATLATAQLDLTVIQTGAGTGIRSERGTDETLSPDRATEFYDVAIIELTEGSGIPLDHATIENANSHANELSLHQGLEHGHTEDELPVQFDQLRLELGDEAFAELLQQNVQDTGTLSGVPIESLGQLDPFLLQQFDQAEASLHQWLDIYLQSTSETDPPQDGHEPVVFELAGDTDGDGAVTFRDFLTLSANFSTTVDTGYLAGDFDLDGAVTFSDFLVLSSNFGTTNVNCGCDVSDANDPDGATKIQSAGELKIRSGSIVFVSDKTVPGDAADLKEDAPTGTPIHTGMKSWQDVVNKLKDVKDGSITGDLVISGHGADGGVWASEGDIDGEDLTAEQAALIKKKLGKGARIVVLGCCQANKQEDEHMQRMANMTGVPVVGNQGSVNDGANGRDDWFRFDPKPKQTSKK